MAFPHCSLGGRQLRLVRVERVAFREELLVFCLCWVTTNHGWLLLHFGLGRSARLMLSHTGPSVYQRALLRTLSTHKGRRSQVQRVSALRTAISGRASPSAALCFFDESCLLPGMRRELMPLVRLERRRFGRIGVHLAARYGWHGARRCVGDGPELSVSCVRRDEGLRR
ncbi:hypothetical protein FKP32DRAFT_104085 [Trametes sanguinea]|nr:hypothetical protein FKP32DRAFT_104085 [Trametes sanguinea]